MPGIQVKPGVYGPWYDKAHAKTGKRSDGDARPWTIKVVERVSSGSAIVDFKRYATDGEATNAATAIRQELEI